MAAALGNAFEARVGVTIGVASPLLAGDAIGPPALLFLALGVPLASEDAVDLADLGIDSDASASARSH